jgi:hypothetical protein
VQDELVKFQKKIATNEFKERDNSQPLPDFREVFVPIHESIDFLHRISNLIKKASIANQNIRARAFQLEDKDVKLLIFNSILGREFPGLAEQLKARLVNSMIERLRRIKYRQSRVTPRLQDGSVQASRLIPSGPTTRTSVPVAESRPSMAASSVGMMNPPAASTTASRETGTTANPVTYHRAAAASHTSSARSASSGAMDDILVPPPPKSCKTALEFICPYCGEILPSLKGRNKDEWK